MFTPRLFVDRPLKASEPLALDAEQTHYLRNVLRTRIGARLILFNGRDGEWSGSVRALEKRSADIDVQDQLRPQSSGVDLWLLAAPLQRSRFELVVEKATELGVARITPIITDHTQSVRIHLERLRLIGREAAEQTERLDLPLIDEPVPLDRHLAGWPPDRPLVWCTEAGAATPITAIAQTLKTSRCALLIGPEGGWSQRERAMIGSLPFARAAGLGPRVLRAETATIAALACVQAHVGDWTVRNEDHRPPERT